MYTIQYLHHTAHHTVGVHHVHQPMFVCVWACTKYSPHRWCTPCTPANVHQPMFVLCLGLHETLYRALSSYGSFRVPKFGNDLIDLFISKFTVYRLTHSKCYYFLYTKQNNVKTVFRTDFLRTSPCKQYRRNTTKHGSARHRLCSEGHVGINDVLFRRERNTVSFL